MLFCASGCRRGVFRRPASWSDVDSDDALVVIVFVLVAVALVDVDAKERDTHAGGQEAIGCKGRSEE